MDRSFTGAHEGLVEILQAMPRPRLAALLCPLVGIDPDEVATIHECPSSVLFPPSFNPAPGPTQGLVRGRSAYADLVVELRTHAGQRLRVLILEVQLSYDRGKRELWPLLEVGASRSADVAARLIVLCPNPKLRAKLRRLVIPHCVRSPVLLEAEHIPLICDYIQARARPYETILGAVFHSREPPANQLDRYRKIAGLRAAYVALATLDPLAQIRLSTVIMSISPDPLTERALTELRDAGEFPIRRFELFSETERGGHSFARGHREGRAEGLEEGREEGLRPLRALVARLLEHKFGPLTPEHQSILEAASSAELERIGARCVDADDIAAALR